MLTAQRVRVAVLCSQRAPGLTHLLARADDAGSVDWEIVCCLTSEETFAEEDAVAARGIPILRHPVRRFYADRAPGARLGDRQVRSDYDRESLRLLQPHRPDIVVLAGYLLVLTPAFLAAFADRVVNIHHADLELRDPSGAPRYPGLRAVRDAVRGGERQTRSSAHLVDADLDGGPILARSGPYPVPAIAAWALATGADDVLRKVIWAHQEWMLRDAFGPLMEQAIAIVAERVAAPVRARIGRR